ncbi:hypothetical protein RASY3_14840 [Ruminococcus albus SY3]|uniref:Uncharacterized protein n=1 Tax=Ruminococcus albus SY3 TaxID=1341156 RepID=A0A011VTL6_RUMAL|nr:hypothetical protein [Ruminococcus albus]EXM38581.1 hypothetical protein RASY3_14840 [Ruminococcus albus SY3]
MKNNDFEVKPCMIETENRCADFGEICCQTIDDRLAFNEFVDKHELPKTLKFDIGVYLSSDHFEF